MTLTPTYDTEQLPGGLTVEVAYDDHPMDPREWDNLGVMVCAHRRYNLGDISHNRPVDAEDIIEEAKEDGARVILPLYLIDHSGLSMSTTDFLHIDPGGWDSGQVGVIYDTNETRDLLGIPEDWDDGRIAKALIDEVEVYDQYLRGQVYGFVVKDEDGTVLDSCWGFFDPDYAMQEGKDQAAFHQRKRDLAEIEQTATYAFNPNAA